MKKTLSLGLLMAMVLLLAMAAGPVFGGNHGEGVEGAKKAQKGLNGKVLGKQDVVGTAVGKKDGSVVLRVFTAKKGVAGIPKKHDGFEVLVTVSGPILALPPATIEATGGGSRFAPVSTELTSTDRWPRPVPIGISIGNWELFQVNGQWYCSVGTLGITVTDGSKFYALSNNHVLAHENGASAGDDGDAVVQPGRVDAGDGCQDNKADDTIGTLYAYESIVFDGVSENTIDAAIALSANLGYATPPDGYGTPSSATVEARVGLKVQKYGRTTQLTKGGKITGINATLKVGYNAGTALFVDQIIIEAKKPFFLKGGDSGSVLVTDDVNANPTGLLFAGNRNGKLAVANPIDAVLARFGVTVAGDEATPLPPPDYPPTVSITKPVDDAPFGSGATIEFVGTADDAKDGDLTSNLVWTSDIDNQIGTGGSFNKVLSDGTHNITATVTDSGDNSGSASISITVGSPPPPPSSLSITVTTDTDSYKLGQTVNISGRVTDDADVGVSGATVFLTIHTPKNKNMYPVFPPVSDGNGNYSFNFKPSKRSGGEGTYGLSATAEKDSVQSNTATTSFKVTK